MSRRFALALGMAIACSGVSVATSPARAATFRPDTLDDAVDAKPGDGRCATAAGKCSLRAAVQEANASTEADTIELSQGTYSITVTGPDESLAASGDFDLRGELTITGRGRGVTIINAQNKDRVFEVAPRAIVQITDVLLRAGLARGGDGGGILNDGTLEVRDVIFDHNLARTDPQNANGRGGSIRNRGKAKLVNVVLGAGTADGRGGGISNSGVIEVMNSSVVNAQSNTDSGGGIENDGEMTLLLSTVASGTAKAGGCIDNVGGTLKIVDGAISGCRADGDGGGLRNSGTLSVVNTTFHGNVAYKNGGALANVGGTAELNNVSMLKGAAANAGAIFTAAGAKTSIANSLVGANTAGPGGAPDCAGRVASLGHNVVQEPAACGFDGPGDVGGKAPGAGDPEPNNGPTRTCALAADSPALGAGSPAPPTGRDGSCAPADQRGVKRPQAWGTDKTGVCDAGAYEARVEPQPTPEAPWGPGTARPKAPAGPPR